jgi:gas vesicle protein
MFRTKTVAAIAAAGATLALLAGCSTGQSTAAACKQIQGDLQSSVTQMQSEASKLQSDPKGAASKLQGLDDKLSKSIDKVDNAEIKKKAETMEGSFQDVVDQIKAYADDPKSVDATKLTKATSQLQKDGAAFDKACKA